MKRLFTYSGIADEAGKGLEAQIKAHLELGWDQIEVRMVDGVQFTEVPEADFERILGRLQEAGLHISCFASGIANWACRISDPMEKSVDTLKRAIPRMKAAGTQFIRTMSWPNDGWEEARWRDESIRRMRVLGKMAEDAGITIAVENCDGWASTSPEAYGAYFSEVDSPAVKAVYDTGNPASHGRADTWNWFQACRPHIGYVHIKAHTVRTAEDKGRHTWPDSGESFVRETLLDLLQAGYAGFVSIEPHLKSVIHEGKAISEEEAAYQTYVEYGRRLMRLVDSLTS